MKVSYNLLNSFFDGKLPSPEVVGDALTFHSWELEELVPLEGDTMIDVKVLPDKSPWALSHRGIAKDLSVILNTPLVNDPLSFVPELTPELADLKVDLQTPTCDRYSAALIENVHVGPSPEWLVKALRTLGQRSINNVVDITNYVMFMTGQPLHAFDAGKLGGAHIVVRNARSGEEITTLTGEAYTLTERDALIVDGATDTPIGIAGIKGGKHAEVDTSTTRILLESAHFNALSVRKTSQRLRLRTDASQRYENGIVSDMTAYGITEAVTLLVEICGGTLRGYADTGLPERTVNPVSVSVEKLSRVLGTSFTETEVLDIMKRFGYEHSFADGTLSVTPPFERTDLSLPEDLIEEIGRVSGYDRVEAIVPDKIALPEVNKRFYYAEKVRDVLAALGFSEVYTSSFRNRDSVKLQNALASDKGYLRSSLSPNLSEALERNIPHKDLLGLPFIGLFEIGTVFTEEGERYMLALGVRHAATYKEKTDAKVLREALAKVGEVFGVDVLWSEKDGVAECELGALLSGLPDPRAYEARQSFPSVTYTPYSLYPAMSRDIALWVPSLTSAEAIETLLNEHAGQLRVRTTLFDRFEKDGRTSYAFRLVFQAHDRTLTDEEVNGYMDQVYSAAREAEFEIR